ncbi:MAG: hypothetical protein J5854_05450 [Clostridia bacterium]|nr:hypothetical protein [Clostridia bacterium]
MYISDGTDAVSVMIGKAAYDLYTVGMRLTVGCADHKIINIRPGIVENEDQFLSFPFVCDEDKDDHTEQKGVLL